MTTLVIFGASGDLTKRKLIPALFHLYQQNLLPELKILGIGRRDLTATFVADMKEGLQTHVQGHSDEGEIDGFLQRLSYFPMFFDEPQGYTQLVELIEGQAIYYLSTAPDYFDVVAQWLATQGLHTGSRLVIEKPFGYDLASAQALSEAIGQNFTEEQIYRIDHYLGKESVQNIPIFRGENTFVEPVWNNRYLDHIQITAAETVGVEDRGPFFEATGALRDMVQNHLMEMVSLTLMDLPVAGESFRDKKIQLLQSIAPIDVARDAIRGQYDDYRQESRVSPTSNTETFVALKLAVNTPRWQGVPIYLRTGKKLNHKVTEIVAVFKKGDRLILRIQPDAHIEMSFFTKAPGFSSGVMRDTMLEPSHATSLSNGYERLLLDIIHGDQTLFVHRDSLEATWALCTPLLDAWAQDTADFPNYTSGSQGPQTANQLLERDNRTWLT